MASATNVHGPPGSQSRLAHRHVHVVVHGDAMRSVFAPAFGESIDAAFGEHEAARLQQASTSTLIR